jgi:hypothetical protein
VADEEQQQALEELSTRADRLDALADTAALMGDDDAAARWRSAASGLRLHAMRLLDD